MYLRRPWMLIRRGSQQSTCLTWTVREEQARTFSIEVSSILFFFWGKANVRCPARNSRLVGGRCHSPPDPYGRDSDVRARLYKQIAGYCVISGWRRSTCNYFDSPHTCFLVPILEKTLITSVLRVMQRRSAKPARLANKCAAIKCS